MTCDGVRVQPFLGDIAVLGEIAWGSRPLAAPLTQIGKLTKLLQMHGWASRAEVPKNLCPEYWHFEKLFFKIQTSLSFSGLRAMRF